MLHSLIDMMSQVLILLDLVVGVDVGEDTCWVGGQNRGNLLGEYKRIFVQKDELFII
jgi:hypothetical protein